MIIWDVLINGVWIECDYGFVAPSGIFWYWAAGKRGGVRAPEYRLSIKTIQDPKFRSIVNASRNEESFIWEPPVHPSSNNVGYSLV